VTELRIVTWNLQGSKGVDVANVARILSKLTAAGEVRIVALQEVQQRHARALAKAWGATDWRWARKHMPYGPLFWWRAEGLAVLSSHDLDDHHITSLTPGIRIWSYRRRILQSVRVDHPRTPLSVFNTHLASHHDPAARAAQAAIVAGQIAADRAASTAPIEVLAGDLNAPDEPTTLAAFVALGLHDAWLATNNGPGFTNPSGAPYQRLDYILTSAEVTTTQARVATDDPSIDWPMLSDHLPLAVAGRYSTGIATTTDERPAPEPHG
jgi:endonuclease/exonuclease/phosphatase family metal-dependent hydrolase